MLLKPLVARDPEEPHRTATTLELFFDLVSVVAIAAASTSMHHAVAEGHTLEGLLYFAVGFFAIWWVWVNFTWFASAYDNQDAPFTISVFVMMFGALLMAVGIPGLFETGQIPSGFIGWVIMRLAMAGLWWRAKRGDSERAETARRYSWGLLILQTLWVIVWLLVPAEYQWYVAPLIILGELYLPRYAENAGHTPWHRHHIIERHGLLNIIVLGEGVVVVGLALTPLLNTAHFSWDLAMLAVSGMAIICIMWWLYFDEEEHVALDNPQATVLWAYGHWIIFASGAATAAGIGVMVEVFTHHAQIPHEAGIWWLAAPLSIYLLGLWLLFDRLSAQAGFKWLLPAGALSICAVTALTHNALAIMLVSGVILGAKLFSRRRN